MEIVAGDIEGEGDLDGQLDLPFDVEEESLDGAGDPDLTKVTGLYDLVVIALASEGKSLEQVLFSEGEAGILGLCEKLWSVACSFLEKGDVWTWYHKLVAVSKMDPIKYRTLSVKRRKELFDLDPKLIKRLARFELSTLLREGKWVDNVFELREEDLHIEVIETLVEIQVRALTVTSGDGIGEESSSQEFSSTDGSSDWMFPTGIEKGSRLYIDSFRHGRDDAVLFCLTVGHLRANDLLDPFISLEEIVFVDEYYQSFIDGIDALIEQGLFRTKEFGTEVVCRQSVMGGVFEGLKDKLAILREMGFLKYLVGVQMQVPFVLNRSPSSLDAFDAKISDDLVAQRVDSLCFASEASDFVGGGEEIEMDKAIEGIRSLICRGSMYLGIPKVSRNASLCASVLEKIYMLSSEGYDWEELLTDDKERNGCFREDVDFMFEDGVFGDMPGVSSAVLDELFKRMDRISEILKSDKDLYSVMNVYEWVLFTTEQIDWIVEVFECWFFDYIDYKDLLNVDKDEMEVMREKALVAAWEIREIGEPELPSWVMESIRRCGVSILSGDDD